MISLKKLKEKSQVIQNETSVELLERSLEEFENDPRKEDVPWIAQKIVEARPIEQILVFRAIEIFSRDKQLQLFERINRSHPDFWVRSMTLLKTFCFKPSIMVKLSYQKIIMGALTTAAVESGITKPELLYEIFRVLLDRMLDFSINYHLLASQFLVKLLNVYPVFSHLSTVSDLKRLFLFDYDCSEIEANERGHLRTIINKQFNCFERLVSLPITNDMFYILLVFAFQIFYHSTLLRLDFLCTSVSTALKRLCEGRVSLADFSDVLKIHDLRRTFTASMKHTSSYRLLVSIFKNSLSDLRQSVTIFEESYFDYFMANYIDWDNPFEYFIVLDQRWVRNLAFEFREEFVNDVVQKVKLDVNHKLRKHGNLLKIFCKFYNRFSKDSENDLPLKLIKNKGYQSAIEPTENRILRWAFQSSVMTLDPSIISLLDIGSRKRFSKDILSFNYNKTISNELDHESGHLAETFGTKIHYFLILTRGLYFSVGDRVTLNGKSNNRFYAGSITKKERFGFLTMFTRHKPDNDQSYLLNTATNKKILGIALGINAYQFEITEIGNNLFAFSKTVDPESSITIFNVKQRSVSKYVIDNLANIEAKVLAIIDKFIVLLNNDENAIEIYLHDLSDAEGYKLRHSKHSYISLWRYGKLFS